MAQGFTLRLSVPAFQAFVKGLRLRRHQAKVFQAFVKG
jgi:hypothetical protein